LKSDYVLMYNGGKMKKVASFTYYGETREKDRTVRLYQNREGTYTVDIEGLPALTQTTPSKDRAEQVFRGWREMSMKDWGASEIDWGDWQ